MPKSEFSESESEQDVSSEEETQTKNKTRKQEKLSDYEEQRLKRIEENKKRMEALGLHKIATSFMGSVSKTQKNYNEKKGKKKIDDEDEEFNPNQDDEEMSSSSEDDENDEDFSGKKMDGGDFNCSDVKAQTRPYHDSICKKMLETKFDSLPDDVVFDILVRIPAQDIYDSTRLVCRKWYQMINSPNFRYSHLQNSVHGLLIQKNPYDQKSPPTFVAMRKGRIEISKLSFEDTRFILSSCNGLILEHPKKGGDLYVTNHLTKRRFALPQIFLNSPVKSYSIVYAPTSMAYKVVHLFYDRNTNLPACAMLTVGVDKSWRRIANFEPLAEKAKGLVGRMSLTVEGFVIWARKSNVLMCNVETEVFTVMTPIPECRENLEYFYLSAGRYLSLLIACSEFSWEVWEMNPETGEWKKLPNIDLEDRNKSLKFRVTPVGWLKYQEVLVLMLMRLAFLFLVRRGFALPTIFAHKKLSRLS